MYADYGFYTDSFYGTAIAEADFPRLSSRASDFLDYYTLGRAAKVAEDDTATLTALGKACCAVAEAMQEDEQAKALEAKTTAAAMALTGNEVKSESVGSWSASYVTAADYAGQNAAEALAAARTRYAALAGEYLGNTGLLYRGAAPCR